MDIIPKRRWEDIVARMETLEGRCEEGLERLGDEIERLKDAVVGGLGGEDGLRVRVAKMEHEYLQLKALTSNLSQAIHGDVLGRNSLVDRVNAALKMAEDAKDHAVDAKHIAHGRVEIQTTRRGQNFATIASIVSVIGVLTVGLMANWDKIQKLRGKEETPHEYAARLRNGIEVLKKTRGPEVEKILRDIELDARKARRGG
jgi:hypothetical protein